MIYAIVLSQIIEIRENPGAYKPMYIQTIQVNYNNYEQRTAFHNDAINIKDAKLATDISVAICERQASPWR